ncbi:MAG: hypothetical protein PHG48_08255, partial [Eubacteriales bacterium]|nr:hypothetical protein [Eubacteriales bacterium]
MIEYCDYRLKTQKNDIGILLPDERQLLRKLALRVKEIAMRPSQSVKIDLWRKHNKLEKVRPMVLAFPEGAWRELIPYETLTIIDPFWRSYEYYLKRLIYRGERIHDDNVIEPIIEVPLVYSFSGWGMGVHTVFSKEERGAVRWEPAIKELKDVEKLKAPTIKIDEDITKRNVNAVAEILGDLLPAQENRFISIDTRLIGAISRMRGIDQLMLDMVDEPEWLHEVMSFMLQSTLKLIDHVEKVGNISSNDGNDYVGTGGVGYSDELRQKDAGDGKTSFKNCWGVSESQDYEMISPIMYDEFAVKYQIPMLEHYGLNCYGCCESLNKKFEI